MFEINEHVISQILAIVLIFLFIGVLIGYIITAVFSKIMFDILGVKAGLAFIPFYNTYRIYKEYKGRVWKRNWGIAYIITFAIPISIIGAIVFLFANLPLSSEAFFEEYAYTLIASAVLFLILGLIIYIFNIIMLFIMYLPIFDTKGRRIVLYIQAGFTVLSAFSTFIFQDSSNILLKNVFSTVQFIFGIVFLVIAFIAATDIRARVRSGKYVLQEKLDYNNLNGYEIDGILKARDRKLVVPVTINTPLNDYQPNNNEEVNRIEYV